MSTVSSSSRESTANVSSKAHSLDDAETVGRSDFSDSPLSRLRDLPGPLDNLAGDQGPPETLTSVTALSDTDPVSAVDELGVGDEGAEVTSLQRDLQRAGFSPGRADGDFGPRTLTAVQGFQQQRIDTLQNIVDGNLPPSELAPLRQQLSQLRVEQTNEFAGPETFDQLQQVLSVESSTDQPVNTGWQVNTDGFISNDSRIVANRVPELERAPFADPIGDIDNVVLHRTVTDTAQQTFNSFSTQRSGSYFGTHFVVARDGTISQTASLDQRTNHVSGHNSSSIGIEVVGMPLDAQGNQTIGPPNGNPVASWEALTPEQAAATAYLTNSLNNYYGLGVEDVAVHEDLQAKTAGEGATVYNAIRTQLID